MFHSKICSSHLLYGLVLVLSGTSHAQLELTPQTIPQPPALFPRQTELFGVTIKVDEVGFAPASRLETVRDSSPRFFIRWSVPSRPPTSWAKFIGLINLPGQHNEVGRITSEAGHTPGTSVITQVSPTAKSYLACWEVKDPQSTPEDNGTFLKTYEFTAPTPTKENKVVTLNKTITTEHGTQITLEKVETAYQGMPTTRATFRVNREQDKNPLSPLNNVSLNGGLESISDGAGKTLKPIVLNRDLFMEPISVRGSVTYIVDGIPDPKSKELKLQLSFSESSPEFRNKARTKRAYIEIPVAELLSEAALKPTAIEAAPFIQSQHDELNAHLDVKGEEGKWRGVLWISPKEKEIDVEATEIPSFSIDSIRSALPNGNSPRIDGRSISPPMGHNDGVLTRDDERAFNIEFPIGEELADTGNFSIVLQRSDFKYKPVKFEGLALPSTGKIIAIPEANRVPQETIDILKVAVLDEALRAELAEKSTELALSVPLGSIVVVATTSNKGISLAPRSISVGTNKQSVEMKLLLQGDPFNEEMFGPYQTFVFATSTPVPAAATFTLEGLTSRQVNTRQLAPIEFKDVPLKFPGT